MNLGRTAEIFEIEIVNRVDSPHVDHRIPNFSLLVGESENSLAPCLENENMNGIPSKYFQCRMTGQYVRVQTIMYGIHMNLCEVKVIGHFRERD